MILDRCVTSNRSVAFGQPHSWHSPSIGSPQAGHVRHPHHEHFPPSAFCDRPQFGQVQ